MMEGDMYEDPEEQDESLTGMPGAGPTRLNQFLSQVGSPASRYREAALQQQQPKQSGGWTDWIVDKLKGPLPDPPPPPKPPGPPNGAVGSPQFELVRAQDAARNDPKNQPDKANRKTFCNIATYQIAQARGAPMDPLITPVTPDKVYPKGQRPAMANEIANNLKSSKSYRVVTAQEAQALANQGRLVIGVQPNKGHGHVATVRPDNLYNETAPANGQGPVMNNIGHLVGIHRVQGTNRNNTAFLSGSQPIYYTPVESH